MSKAEDFFFSPYPTAQERRLQAALADGLAHVSRIEPHDPTPEDTVTLLFSTKIPSPITHVAVYYTTDGNEPQGEKGHVIHGQVVQAQPEPPRQDETVQQWRAILPAQSDGTLVRYRADGWNGQDEQSWQADRVDPVSIPERHGRIFAYHVDRWTPPQWWNDAVVYQIFVDRFSSAHDEPPLLAHDAIDITGFFGGTLRGISEKLDYIQTLGANCLWLSPVFESPTHHGYNATDYYTVAKRYGTNEQLKQLIQEAHARGMRVMLDFAANHTSNEHPAFLAALHDPTSPTRDWYSIGETNTGTYHSYASETNMPELMTDNPQVRQYLCDVGLHWLRDFGADALRLDYVPGPSYAFWTIFQQEIKTHYPQAITLGEITAPLAEIANYAGRVDAYMDFPLTRVFREVFARRTATVADLLTYLEQRQSELPTNMSRATLLDNHDMHRFLWLAHGSKARLKLAATCHLTLDGTPIIYYGTEVGLSQYDDAHKENAYARAPMLWGAQQDTELYEHYRRLLALRQSAPALRYGQTHTVPLQIITPITEQDQQQVGAYLRSLDGHYLLIILNNTDQELQLDIDLIPALQKANVTRTDDKILQDIFTQQPVTVNNGHITCTVAAQSAQVLESGTNCTQKK